MDYGINIMLLDACRTELPLSTDRNINRVSGLAAMNLPPSFGLGGNFVSYAAGLGEPAKDFSNYGDNSPYLRSLLNVLKKYAGEDIDDIFKQVAIGVERDTGGKQHPWKRSNLKKEFCFHPKGCAKTVWRRIKPEFRILTLSAGVAY